MTIIEKEMLICWFEKKKNSRFFIIYCDLQDILANLSQMVNVLCKNHLIT